ncbi:amidohydrolase family protein [Paenibacillus sp. P25]|nr:amidohydrolase family protein [Paenibacillus sp. P25]
MYDLVFRNVRPLQGLDPAVNETGFGGEALTEPSPLIDIGIQGGTIAAVGKLPDAAASKEIDGEGRLVLPPFVESHVHLDTVLTAGDPAWNVSGTLFEGITLWRRRKTALTREDVLERAEKVLRSLLSHGVLHVRTHADISEPGLTALRASLELRERVKPYMNLQVIAFPQDGIRACPGNAARLEEALKLGADGVSAIPHGEATREEGVLSLEICFDLAARYGRVVHLFCDELDDPHSRYLECAADLAIRTGLGERVTASHVNATAYYSDAYFGKLLGLLARSGINIVCCPLINSAMQGRFDAYPKGRGIARIKEMWQAGVNVSIAHDDIRSPFYPLGSGSLLQAAHMAVHLAHMTGREELLEALRMVTYRAARTLGTAGDYGIAPGKPASFVILPAGIPPGCSRSDRSAGMS